MAGQYNGKLNKLLHAWPHGMVATSPWLKQQGISRQLINEYEKSKWVIPVGHGAFARPEDKITWFGALAAIQQQMNKPVHVGARASLELLGLYHYARAKQTVFLFGPQTESLPAWFREYEWPVEIKFVPTNLFGKARARTILSLTTKEIGPLVVRISPPERAILETLYLVPKSQGIDEAYLLMEGLHSLRPELLQRYLEVCNSIKAKRLFMAFAEKLGHPWYEKLKLNRIDLGRGVRLLVKGGRTHPKYKITLPESFYNESQG